MLFSKLLITFLHLAASAGARTTVKPFSIKFQGPDGVKVRNSAILAGATNTSVTPVSASSRGEIVNWTKINPQVTRVSINSTSAFTGARFAVDRSDLFYGVWEYPWDNKITNNGVEFQLLGVGNAEGINWSNARAPFFITTAGYGVYADTDRMGSFDFSQPGQAQFIFNTSSLVYYIITPESKGHYKSIIREYTAISSRIEMPPDSSYGPTFWSDDFEQDFHGSVSNAQENYYDVVNHLYYNRIRASSMFADRPYGTGNMSWGNFDFDPKYYPTPKEFIANLSTYGFEFQIWAANRAFLDTQLYNDSVAHDWLFPGYDPERFLGPALNLSIPAAYEYFLKKLSYFTSLGVKGYKIDRGEEQEMPFWEQNIQQPLFEKLLYTNMKDEWGQSNFYNFARSVFDRSRSRTAVWNGDSHANFTGLAYTVASGIRAGLLAFSQWGADTGGYVRHGNEPSEELWARWMHFSTFSPVYEIMIGTKHTPWYNPYTPRLVSILKQTADLHTALLPYIKSHTWEASQTGVPVIRALFLEYPSDANPSMLTTTDAYAFGSAFLVAPVVTAGGERDVYFPADSHFLEYFNKTSVHQGGTSTHVQLDWEEVPVYVREGAIVPKGDIYQGNAKWVENWQPYLEIEVFPSWNVKTSKFEYYDGERTLNTSVPIEMTTDRKNKCITVRYGRLGVSATLLVYGKGEVRKFSLEEGGGSVTINGLESLFASP